jgi:hypothetical protein
LGTTLVDLIQRLNDALEGEAAKRRWGRGLTYFHQQASSAKRLDISTRIAPLVIEFLSDRYSLKRNGESQPATVHAAVEALEQECRRIVREKPVHCFTWGVILGGDSPQVDSVNEFIDSATAEEPIDGADFAISFVLQIAGRLVQADWTGVQAVRTSIERRRVFANVAPPRDIQGAELYEFLRNAMQESVEGADRSIKRKKLAWSTQPHRALIAKLRPKH